MTAVIALQSDVVARLPKKMLEQIARNAGIARWAHMDKENLVAYVTAQCDVNLVVTKKK